MKFFKLEFIFKTNVHQHSNSSKRVAMDVHDLTHNPKCFCIILLLVYFPFCKNIFLYKSKLVFLFPGVLVTGVFVKIRIRRNVISNNKISTYLLFYVFIVIA